MSSLPKPVLRGHLRRSGLKMLVGAITVAACAGTLYKVLVAIPRQNAYNEFVKTYDPEKHFEELVKYDRLQAVRMTKDKM